MLLAILNSGSTTADSSDSATPTGWSLVRSKNQPHAGSPFVGIAIDVFSRTAVAGDIGQPVTFQSFAAFVSDAELRTYTCGGVDSSAGAGVAGTSLAPPSLVTSQANEMLVAFLAACSSATAQTFTLAAGGSNALGDANLLSSRGAFYGEDWAVAAAGGTSTGGGLSDGAGSANFAGVSITLLPS